MIYESKSYSLSAAVRVLPNRSSSVVEYIYSNSPKVSVQNRSQAHDGACVLDVIKKPDKKFVGKYWTDRNTKGEIDFKFLSKELKQEFL